MDFKPPIFAIALVLLGAGAQADTGYDFTVATAPDGAFDITPKIPGGDTVFWCAASEHARRALGASGSDRIYAFGRTALRTARFSLTAPASGPVQTFTLSLDEVGNNLSVAAAFQYCLNETINE